MVNYSKAIGGNTDFLSSQAFVFPKIIPFNQEGQNFLAVIISGAGDDCFTRIRQASPFIEEHFYSQREELDHSSEKSIPNRLIDLLPQLKEHLTGVQNLQILLVSWKDNVLYLLSSGTHQAFIQRKEKKLNLTEHSPFEEIVSGHLKPEDKILLISGRSDAQQINWKDEHIEQLLASNTEELEEDIDTLLAQTQPEPVAAILVENKLEEAPSQPKKNESATLPSTLSMPKVSVKFPPVWSLIKLFVPRSRRSIIITIVVLLIALTSGYFTYRYYQKAKLESQSIASDIAFARNKLAEAQAKNTEDPELAQQSLNDAKTTISGVLARAPKNSEALKLKQEIDGSNDSILRIYQYTDWPIFLSLDLIKDGFTPKRLSYSSSKVLMMDEKQKTLVEVDLKKKTNNLLAGAPQLGTALAVSLNGDKAFVYSQDKGVLAIDTENQKITVVSPPAGEWGFIQDIVGFAGNVYLLDSMKNQIWKYFPTSSGWSNIQTYLSESAKPDFSGAKQMKIDYSVWVLKTGPEILRFTGGNADNFSVGGLDTNVKELKTLFADEDGEELYLLDSENSRVVVLKKSGEYIKQYKGDKFATADDLVVDSEEKKMYLLEGNKLYQLDLR